MRPDKIYYEPAALEYDLGKQLKETFTDLLWIPIESHNRIEELQKNSNQEFAKMKRHLIIGVRKTHKYTDNFKVSDYLVPYTSSGCTAMCLYCYLVCNYNKCSYLRLFVNREEMLGKIMKHAEKADRDMVYEIGSNSDLVLENSITGNLVWTIEAFAKSNRGKLTFPTKFDMVEPLLHLNHKGNVIFRMSVNPQEIIKRIEFGTSPLEARIHALNLMCEAGYPVGMLIAPVIMLEDWKEQYEELLRQLSESLSEKVKKSGFIEVIFMTYSFVQNAINTDAFPNAATLYEKENMTGRGRGKYCYRKELREDGERFLKEKLAYYLSEMKILYIV